MKILVTGSKGLLGTKLMNVLSKKFDVVGTDINDNTCSLDICDKKKIIELFKKSEPSIVIHAAAYTNVDRCEIEKETCYNINVNGTKNIIEAAKQSNSKLIYISTDFVFDGEKGNYKEEDIPNPINYYSKTNLSEFHSGYRLYNIHALKKIPFYLNSDDFHFDTEIIIQFIDKKLRIAEIPIPTYYGEEISYVNVLQYGLNVIKSVLQYRLHKLKIVRYNKFE